MRCRAANRASLFSICSLAVAAAFLLAPNGMNRTIHSPHVPPTALVKRLAAQVAPFFGTRVAAKCVDRQGRTTVVDPDEKCKAGTSRSDVIVQPDASVTEGIPAAPPRDGPPGETLQQQCVALEQLLRVIEQEARRPWPEARHDELLALGEKAREERQRLAC